ncbi:hypothetical protein [Brevibacillus brevis]|uniref:hypothetical protein n=1 Tax=Brevibacillus brevis TaxID=1393 RepID=UPI0025A52DED|nr:hypothetical protein [Brevibacillus brevis]WJQ82603.1 hypothetical protein QN310_05500 [Brevibacillus brevis]
MLSGLRPKREANASALTWSLCECAGQGLSVKPSAGLSAKPAWHISLLHIKAKPVFRYATYWYRLRSFHGLPGYRDFFQ